MKKSLCDEMWRPLCKKILHPFVTKLGLPYTPVTKRGNPYGQTTYPYNEMWSSLCKKKKINKIKYYTHLWRNRETLMPLLLNEETLMARQFTSMTKCGSPYAKKYYTHLWRNREPLTPLLLNGETLMGRQFTPTTKCGAPYEKDTTPICDEIGRPLCPCY